MAEGGARPTDRMKAGEKPSDVASFSQSKKKNVFPKLNDEGELSLDGRPKPLSITAKVKAKVVSSEESSEIPNVSVVAKVLPPKQHQEPPQKPEKPETHKPSCRLRTSMESLKFPFKFSRQDSDDDDGFTTDMREHQCTIAGDLKELGYIRGLAFSAIHDRDFAAASEYLRRELSGPSKSSISTSYYEYDVILTDLECDLCMMECSQIDRKCTDFEGNLSRVVQDNSVSFVDLVQWIEELRSIDRPFGSILLCRAVILLLLIDDIQAQTVWYFNLSYFIFVEMCLRTIHLLGKEAAYTDAIKVIFDSMEKAICKMKTSIPGREDPDVSEHMKNKIGVCYLALSYLCNCVKLYESAGRCAEDGLQILSSQCLIRVDLLINQTLSFMGRGNIAEAMTRVQRAKTSLGNLKPKRLQSGERTSREKWRTRLVEEIESKIKARGREAVKGLFDA